QLLQRRLGIERHAGRRRRLRGRGRLARLADPWRHDRLVDLAVAAQGTAQLALRQLCLIGSAAREPAFELVVLGAFELEEDHSRPDTIAISMLLRWRNRTATTSTRGTRVPAAARCRCLENIPGTSLTRRH